MNRFNHIATWIIAVAFWSGCTVMTDFTPPGALYSLDDNIAEPVVLSVSGTEGQMVLRMSKPLPEADDEDLLVLLDDGTIQITVESQENGTSYLLTDGTRTDDDPQSEGEFRLSLDENRKEISVRFYNLIQQRQLTAGKFYKVAFQVRQNEYFEVDSFSIVDVEITQGQ